MTDVTGDYSCGNCGWYGTADSCELTLFNDMGDGELCCPDCGSDRVGEITKEDFAPGNALHGYLWNGEDPNKMTP